VSIDIVTDEALRYWLRIDLDEWGDLVLEGQDLSERATLFGRDEYEYWYRVKGADVSRLLTSLGVSANSGEQGIAELLRVRFALEHGINTSSAFKAWCEAHQIPYTFHSY
jgi:hypothetical protein